MISCGDSGLNPVQKLNLMFEHCQGMPLQGNVGRYILSSLEDVLSEGHSKKLCEHITQVGNGTIRVEFAGIMFQLKSPYRNGLNFV